MYHYSGALPALSTMFTTTWSTNMNEVLLFAAVPIAIVVLAVVYYIADYYWMNRSTCRHSWSRWSDPRTDGGHPYQLHICARCNLYEHRLIK
jgi:hypothetical protein